MVRRFIAWFRVASDAMMSWCLMKFVLSSSVLTSSLFCTHALPLDIKPAKIVKTQPSYRDIQRSQTLPRVMFPNLGHLDVAAK